jgi:hypothetical protein
MIKTHSFHIPVMGIGFTIDTPLKVAHYGIDSVISLGDDMLLEKLRKMYCGRYSLPYNEISEKTDDFRAKRITSYLNLINVLVKKNFESLKNAAISNSSELKKYFGMLPENSPVKKQIAALPAENINDEEIIKLIKEKISVGSIDVNIMTKIDKDNYLNNEKLPVEYNDAHAALRGYANSDLNSSLIFSAGMNPRLYGYIGKFKDFYPDEEGVLKKKIVLKVSNYRSAFIQGKFLAKKGIWVSEYRIESGLNCGGHAFATDGFLLGPILEEFKTKRMELLDTLYTIYIQALREKNCLIPKNDLSLRITAQGGVGTSEEHQFLIDYYGIDSVGWGTPFLLVPEATTVDQNTLNKLIAAREEDLYLSDISPLGIPFNSLRGNTKDIEKLSWIKKGRPGSPCPKKYLALHKEFTERTICTASRQYQHLKIKELESENLSPEEHQFKYDKIVEKACICVGLGTTALLANNIETKVEGEGVSICPGPNIAYFSRIMSLKDITDHIYGRANMISRTDRPNFFIKEFQLYIDYIKNKIAEANSTLNEKQDKYLLSFVNNLNDGLTYYESLFNNFKELFEDKKSEIIKELASIKETLNLMRIEIENKILFISKAV